MIERISARLSQLETNPIVQYGLLAAITLLAVVLRFYKLGEWSFWIDELRTVGHVQAHYSSFEAIIYNIPPARNWVPLSLIFTGGALNAFGVSEWAARLAPAIIGIISIPILYFPVKRLFSPGVGLLTALLLAVSPWHLFWSQNARFLTSLMLLYSLALFAFFFGLERDRPRYILLFIVLLYLATSERLLALFILPVVICYLLLLKILPFEKPPGLRIRNLFLMILPVIFLGIYQVYTYVANRPSILDGIAIEIINTFVGLPIENPLTQATFIGFEIGIPMVTLSFFGGLYLLLQKSRAGLFFFLGAIVPFVLVILLTRFMFTEERYAFVTLPSWLILGAIAVKEIFAQTKNHGKLLAVGVLILLLADAAGANLRYYRVNNGNRRDWKGAFALVRERSTEGDILVSTWPELGTYYLDQEFISWQDIDTDTVVQSGKRVWFVIIPAMAWFWQNQDVYWWVSENSELVEVKYLRRQDDASLFIYLHDPAQHTLLEKSR